MLDCFASLAMTAVETGAAFRVSALRAGYCAAHTDAFPRRREPMNTGPLPGETHYGDRYYGDRYYGNKGLFRVCAARRLIE